MSEFTLYHLVLLPIGFGLLGFVEPCSIGSTLLFVKYLEGKSATGKIAHAGAFALTRSLFIGLMGVVAVEIGAAFLGFQRAAWVLLGGAYVLLGTLYLVGRARVVVVSIGNDLARLFGLRGAAALGVVFGLNIPACAAPLVLALIAAAAAGGTEGAAVAAGFVSLALFGLALSLPVVVAVLFEPARRALDWLASLSRRLPFWTGLLLIGLGLWSIWLAVSAMIAAA